MIKTKRLPLEGLCNARDLGGFPALGGYTRFGVYVRSEVPKDLTEKDLAFLRAYGVTTSLDLRGPKESEDTPSRLKGAAGIDYRLCPMMDEAAAAGSEPHPEKLDLMKMEWLPVYIGMCERGKGWTKSTLELAAAAEGCVHFHCFTGKDRTGVFSALLLGLCGVDQRDIIGDYSLSMVNLRPFYEQMPLPNEEVGKNKKLMYTGFYRTGPDTMEGLLDHFREKYGGVEGYVRACGVSDAVIQRIREKFIEPGE